MKDELRRFKAEIFQALAHPTRIAIVEALQHGELPAGKLIEQLGLEQANASQHLAILRAKKIVTNRKSGNQVLYSLRDPVINEVLLILRRYFFSQLADTKTMLEEIRQEGTARRN
jgi:DNA-binding transcriptional ArsR family regulator